MQWHRKHTDRQRIKQTKIPVDRQTDRLTVYQLLVQYFQQDPGINWVVQLDWIEPQAVMGRDCCSRVGDIWSLGKLTEALLKLALSYTNPLRVKERQHQIRLNAFVHLSFHKRQFRPDAKFLIEVLRTKSFSSLNICSCQENCGMQQKQ